MEASNEAAKNPLGLSLDFMFGRGYLWAQRQRLSDWISLETLRMEIPDLKFPFDARTGLDRFRHTRCLVRDVEVGISEVGLGDLLTEAASHLEGFEELQVRFLEDAAHISLRLNAFGARSYLSFRAALIPPEPARADEVHLSLYDYRSFGPLPYPARLVAHELLTSLLNTPVLRASGRGKSFTLGIAGDIVSFRPLKLLFLHIFPPVGWKLPDLSGVVLESAQIRPGVLSIRAVDADPSRGGRKPSKEYHLATSTEGARALAAYEAKELFSHADQALFEGQLRQALNLLGSYRDIYGLHPELVARTMDCLLAEPGPGNLAEAEAMRRELVKEDPGDVQAAMVGPLLAMARHRDDEVVAAFERLAELLKERRESRDWMLAELSLVDRLWEEAPEEAVRRVREVLKRDPRNRAALERLRGLYARLGEKAGLEETLKRLTGVYTDRDTLKTVYLQLARHLMDREGELAEARMYLEKVLRLDPSELDALYTLGESYVLGGEPLRALKAFGSAARAAEAGTKPVLASDLHYRVGQIWQAELEDPRQALLSFRRAISLWRREADEGPSEALAVEKQVEQLEAAAEICDVLERDEEATEYWDEVVRRLERVISEGPEREEEESRGKLREALLGAHRRLGALYERRGRWPAASSHHRRILEYVPGDEAALAWLEKYLRQAGQPEELIALYQDLREGVEGVELIQDLTIRLADLYAGMGLLEDAQEHYRQALERAPGRRDVRRRLVDLLVAHGRYGTLRENLNSILAQTRGREDRVEILVELGDANAGMGDFDRALRAYLEAVTLSPADREVLEKAVAMLEGIVDEKGIMAAAPVGTQSAGKLLESMLIRLAEVAPTPGQAQDALLKMAMLADERGDGAAAEEARNRARALSPARESGEVSDIDQRLDAMLGEYEFLDGSEDLEELDEFQESDRGETFQGAERQGREADNTVDGVEERGDGAQARFLGADTMPKLREREGSQPGELSESADSAARGEDLEATSETSAVRRAQREELAQFRERFQSMMKKPAVLLSPEATEASEREAQTSSLLRTGIKNQPASLAVEAPEDELSEPTRSEGESELAESLKELEALRGRGSDSELVEAIEKVLRLDAALGDQEGPEGLSEAKRNELRREAGELYFYELEDGEGALPHLEALRESDPEGLGSEIGVVNALEAIYEEIGAEGARIRLMEERLEAAQTPEMKTTYRLLLAQLVWDEQKDRAGATRWLKEVLASEPENEAAHRLLADMARAAGEYEVVGEHLEVVVKVAGGGLDAVEAQRELADLYLNQLDRPEEAAHHFEAVLLAAPGDSNALEGIKETQARRKDWAGYVESLGRELGLLIANPEGLTLEEIIAVDPGNVAPALRVSASQIVADTAQIVEEELELLEEARLLWGLTYRLWPEHVEALERRIALHRRSNHEADLAEDLESLAGMLLESRARFDALVEAARLRADTLDELDGARELYAEAIALVQDHAEPPEGLDAARRALKSLQSGDSWRE